MAVQKIYITVITGQVWNGSTYTYVTWRFATKGGVYNGDFYDGRIKDLPILKVTPTDGGILPFNTGNSIGDMSLINTDFALNTFLDYGTYKGTFYYVTDAAPNALNNIIEYTVDRIAETGKEMVLQLKTLAESFQDAFTLDTYAGSNTLPAGLEGTSDIAGNIKPKVYGKVKNISPVLVNESLLIYQASSLSNCVITAVYDDGVKLQDYQISHTGGYAAGTMTLAIAKGHGGLPTNTVIAFADHPYTYTVASGIAGTSGTITIVNNYDGGGLYMAVTNREGIAVVGFYASTSALQSYNYFVNGKQIAGTKSIPLITGSGTISTGDKIHFTGHNAVYTVATGITAPGTLVLTKGLTQEVNDGELVHKVESTVPWLWGSYQGYFRLTGKPKGQITCDAMSLNTNHLAHKAGDLINEFVSVSGISVNPLDAGTVSTLNYTNYLSIYIDEPISYIDLLNKVCRSIGAYLYVGFNAVQAGFIKVPAGSPSTGGNTLSDYQIIDIQRNSIALSDNGLPIYKILMQHSRIETVQPTVAGAVSNSRRNYLKKQYRQKIVKDDNTIKTHAASKQLNIESLLWRETEATVVLNRLLPLVKVRRDYVTVTIHETEFNWAWTYAIGETFFITTPRMGYGSGRLMVFAEYDLDLSQNLIRMGFYG